MADVCGDNRFEIIEKAKKSLIESTNINTSPDEMKVLNNFLFRCWQMSWLDCYDETKTLVEQKHGRWIRQAPNPEVMEEFHAMGIGKSLGVNSIFWTCSNCGSWGMPAHKYCQHCGAKMQTTE